MAFPTEYEEVTTSLYMKAWQGSRYLWEEMTSLEELRNNAERRKQFYSAANKGSDPN
ncbi:hypothetical protein PDPUS_2_00794 [Photobacterium damselae subsp. piscicida]|uniref:Uncharacterized protein n=1 Tax=Photobacterium damsela subsp. piscicida TaxID=38294 RepID=A0A7L8A855_PHODP|nr:hypothetical protein [Photobacterium damselae subsp. piscicida]MDP2516669.1 hypothetical protein [Photobacterium damselae subsp. piscicida]QOD58266.1 hypothetical protein IC627_21175 [Photobacterium damselae subsp. piscicida]BAX55380.1 hypothetical protein PDPUS_2_00794 [Photobacterium damselae subsp. piscicida]